MLQLSGKVFFFPALVYAHPLEVSGLHSKARCTSNTPRGYESPLNNPGYELHHKRPEGLPLRCLSID